MCLCDPTMKTVTICMFESKYRDNNVVNLFITVYGACLTKYIDIYNTVRTGGSLNKQRSRLNKFLQEKVSTLMAQRNVKVI